MMPTLTVAFLSLLILIPCLSDASTGLPPVDSGWTIRDAEAREAHFRDLVARGTATEDPAYTAEAITQLARAVGLFRRFEEAHGLLDDAQAMLNEEVPAAERTRIRVRLLLERGRVFNSSGDPRASVPYFEEALTLAGIEGLEYYAIDAAHMHGIVESPEAAIRWNERAIAMAEAAQSERARGWLGPLYNNLAWTYNDLGRHEAALSLFEKDIVFREQSGQRFEASIARWSRAKTLRLLGRAEEALTIQQGLVAHPDRQGNEAEGYTHEEIGECLLLLDRSAEAAPHFAIAYERLSGDVWLSANEPDRLARLLRLSEGAR